jgi:ribonuclease HI
MVYASAVLGIALPRYYWALKQVRRRFNALNRGLVHPDDVPSISTSVKRQLHEWLGRLTANKPVSPLPRLDQEPRATLYTDASGAGWGAVLFLETGETFVAGEPWPKDFDYEVNRAEARAVRLALEAFKVHFDKNIVIKLKVDNTSVEAAVKKGVARSHGITKELKTIMETGFEHGWKLNVSYVKSAENPADSISRGDFEGKNFKR